MGWMEGWALGGGPHPPTGPVRGPTVTVYIHQGRPQRVCGCTHLFMTVGLSVPDHPWGSPSARDRLQCCLMLTMGRSGHSYSPALGSDGGTVCAWGVCKLRGEQPAATRSTYLQSWTVTPRLGLWEGSGAGRPGECPADAHACMYSGHRYPTHGGHRDGAAVASRGQPGQLGVFAAGSRRWGQTLVGDDAVGWGGGSSQPPRWGWGGAQGLHAHPPRPGNGAGSCASPPAFLSGTAQGGHGA